MAYEFPRGDITGKAAKRIAKQQLTRLGEQLHDPAGMACGHHEARKCVKRLRALLLLTRPTLGNSRWRRIDRRLGAIGRTLSAGRDAQVLMQLLDRLQQDHGVAAVGETGRDLRAALAQRHDREADKIDTAELARRVEKLRRRIKKLPLAGLRSATALRGLEAHYRAARTAFARAYATQNSEEFHHLRKHVQAHWRHMHLFAAGWPVEMRARQDLAQSLSELLGEERELWLLRQALRNGAAQSFKPTSRNDLDALCRQRQARLRASAFGPLRQLLAERPKALRRRLAAYWAAGVGGTASPKLAADTAPADLRAKVRLQPHTP